MNEHTNPQHGARAADFVRQMAEQSMLPIDDTWAVVLAAACARHELGDVSYHPTVGCCCDADWLALERLHRPPKAELLSTKAALEPDLQRNAWTRGVNQMVDPILASEWRFAAEMQQYIAVEQRLLRAPSKIHNCAKGKQYG